MYQIVYTGEVVRKDIPKLDGGWKAKLKLTIEARLASSPEVYGKPLSGTLKNYRKLRVGSYRVIFRIERNRVRIVGILHRSVAYKILQKRL